MAQGAWLISYDGTTQLIFRATRFFLFCFAGDDARHIVLVGLNRPFCLDSSRPPSRIPNRKGTHFRVLSWKHFRAFTLTFALVRASLWLHVVVVPALWWQKH